MRRYLIPAAICLALGVVSVWLIGCGSAFLVPPGSDHAPGAGKFKDWGEPKYKYLHIYLSMDVYPPEHELAGCPMAIHVFPNDDAAQISRKYQPKKILWKVQGVGPEDEWTIETKSAPDHFPGAKMIKRTRDQDTWWSKRPVAAGQSPKADWLWKYKVTVARPECPAVLLDPPVYIRKR